MPLLEPVGGARPPELYQGAVLEGGKMIMGRWGPEGRMAAEILPDTPSAHHTPADVILTLSRGAPLFHVNVFTDFMFSIS